MKRSVRSWLALLAVVSLVAAACGGDGEPSPPPAGAFQGVDITFSTSLAEEEQATVEEVIGQFEETTGATVNITAVTAQELPQKLQVEVDSGQHTIHLFAQDNLGLGVLVAENLVEDLSDVEIPGGVVEAMIPDQFDGTQYFLPYRPNVKLVYANTDRFEEAGVQPPTTVEELRSAAQALRDAGGGPKVVLQFATEPDTGPLGVTISEWIVSFGGDPLILNDEGSVAAFEFLQGMWRDNLLARESLQSKFDTDVDYLQGETAWLAQNWPFTSNELLNQGLLDRFQIYDGWAGPDQEVHVVGGEVLGIPRGVSGQQKEAAIALAQHLMSREAQETLVAENGWPSVRSDALGQVSPEQQETFEAIQAALENGWFRPNVVYWSDVEAAMAEGLRRVIVGGETAQPVLDELHAGIESAAQSKGAEYPPPGQ